MRITEPKKCHGHVLEEILRSFHVLPSPPTAHTTHRDTQELYSNSTTESRGVSEAHLCKELLLSDSGEDQRMSLGWEDRVWWV